MKRNRNALAGTIIGGALVMMSANAEAQSSTTLGSIRRVDLLQYDLSVPGYQTIQVYNEFQPGVVAPKHRHPGEELVYVLEGEMEYDLDGRQPVVLKKGEVLVIPMGTYHVVKNVGSGVAVELGTYIVPKGKPPVELAK